MIENNYVQVVGINQSVRVKRKTKKILSDLTMTVKKG